MKPKSKVDGLFSSYASRLSFFLSGFVPGLANSKIDELLLIPNSNQTTAVRIPKEFRQSNMKTRDGLIHVYEVGSGPTVVFVHGWGGGAHQFFPLMRGLARCGFTSLAFDQLGHGQSESKQATIHQSIVTTNFVLQYVKNKSTDGLYAILGHSTGCIAIANCSPSTIRNAYLFLISPVFKYKIYFLKKLQKLPMSTRKIKKYAADFVKEYKVKYMKLSLVRHLPEVADMTVIVHDRSDAQSPVAHSEAFCTRYPLTKLLVTRGFGHNRVIVAETLWQELKSHLNYEDTTINFAQNYLRN